MKIWILTLFPEYFESPLKVSLLGKAIEQKVITVETVNIRSFGEGTHKIVDDRPFGGGAGMVFKAPVLEQALQSILGTDLDLQALEEDVKFQKNKPLSEILLSKNPDLPLVIYMSPQGQTLNAELGRVLGDGPQKNDQDLILLCGHYEGVDERFLETFCHLEISIGDYILMGGEVAALVLLESVSRFIAGVVGDATSVASDTFEKEGKEAVPGGLKAPCYTRPSLWRGQEVPAVLLSGHHSEIEKWRRLESEKRTQSRRPDLLKQGKKK